MVGSLMVLVVGRNGAIEALYVEGIHSLPKA